jgi:hypothetical protein
MSTLAKYWTDGFSVVHLLARVLSLVSIGTILLFIIGENSGKIAAREWLGLLFFPLGVGVGMIVGWWRAILGGAIAVGSLTAFYMVFVWVFGEHFWQAATLYFFVFTIPGFLFLINGLLARRALKKLDH